MLISLEINYQIFPKSLVSQKMAAILNFSQNFAHHKNAYRIYCNKRPLPINRPPPLLYLCKIHISGFYIPVNSQHLCDSGIPKNGAF